MPDDHDLLQQRLDYAWRYFESAARQRMLFFNYYLIIVGVLVNGYVLAVKESMEAVAAFICILGIVSCLAFIAFDVRTLGFVRLAVAVLEHIERTRLFPDDFVAGSEQLGLMRKEAERRKKTGAAWLWTRALDHKIWIRGIQAIVLVAFILGLFYLKSHGASEATCS